MALCREKMDLSGATPTSKQNHLEPPLLNADLLERVVANSGEVWAIFQPYAHLNSSRTSGGSLSLSKCVEAIVPTFYDALETARSTPHHHAATRNSAEKHKGSTATATNERNVKQILLTTCIGSTEELEEMVLTASALFQQVWSEVPLPSNRSKGKSAQYNYGPGASSREDNNLREDSPMTSASGAGNKGVPVVFRLVSG